MTSWAAFWIAVAVFFICECVITLHGIDTMLWRFKTSAEKQIQSRLATIEQPEAGGDKS